MARSSNMKTRLPGALALGLIVAAFGAHPQAFATSGARSDAVVGGTAGVQLAQAQPQRPFGTGGTSGEAGSGVVGGGTAGSLGQGNATTGPSGTTGGSSGIGGPADQSGFPRPTAPIPSGRGVGTTRGSSNVPADP